MFVRRGRDGPGYYGSSRASIYRRAAITAPITAAMTVFMAEHPYYGKPAFGFTAWGGGWHGGYRRRLHTAVAAFQKHGGGHHR